jgi:hypothetical protein
MLSDILHRLAALPVWAKPLLVPAALAVLGLSVLSSLMVTVLVLLLLVSAGPEEGPYA